MSAYSLPKTRTGRTTKAGDYCKAHLRASANNRQVCLGYAAFSGVKSFTVVPVVTWADYPTGIIDIPLSGGNPTSGAPSAIYDSYSSYGNPDQWVWTRPGGSLAEMHGIELRYMCVLYQTTTRMIVWMSSGSGYTVFQQPCTPPPTQGLNLTYYPNIDFDFSVDFEMIVGVDCKERLEIDQPTGDYGKWIYPAGCFEDGMGKTYGTYTARGDSIDCDITINGSSFTMPSGYVPTYDFDFERNITGKVGLYTSMPSFWGWGEWQPYTPTPYLMSGSTVYGSLTDVASMSMGVTEMDLHLREGQLYQGDATNCRGTAQDTEIHYWASNSPSSATGYDVSTTAAWTNLGCAMKFKVDFADINGETSLGAIPEFKDQSNHTWTDTTSDTYIWDGVWDVVMKNLSGSTMATRNTETDAPGSGAHWARSNPAPSGFSLKLTNPEAFNDMDTSYYDPDTDTTVVRDDFRVQFPHWKDNKVGDWTQSANVVVDPLSSLGTLGVAGWTGYHCIVTASGGNLIISDITNADAYIYRKDFGGNYPNYRFNTLALDVIDSESVVPTVTSLTLQIERKISNNDTFSKTFSYPHCVKNTGSPWFLLTYDICKPDSAGSVDICDSLIGQTTPLDTKWVGGARVEAEKCGLSWSTGISLFDYIQFSGFVVGNTYTLIDFKAEYFEPYIADVEPSYYGKTTYVQKEVGDVKIWAGDTWITSYEEDAIPNYLWRQIIAQSNGKEVFEIPSTKLSLPPSGVEIRDNLSLKDGSTTYLARKSSYGEISINLNADFVDNWDATNEEYPNDNIVWAGDTCPVWFTCSKSSHGEQDNLHITDFYACPVFDVISIYPSYNADDTVPETRTGVLVLKPIKRVRGRLNGVYFKDNLLPVYEELTHYTGSAGHSDKYGYYRSPAYSLPASISFSLVAANGLQTKNCMWIRVCINAVLGGWLRYNPATGELLFKYYSPSEGALSACNQA